MTALRRIVFEEACLAAGFLTAAWCTFYVAAIWGLADHYRDGLMKDYLTGPGIHVEMILSALFFGGVVALVNRLTEDSRFRQRPVSISGRMQEAIGPEGNYSTTLEGEIVLRGKTEPVPVFGVTETLSTLA